ncbi:MAG: hypothetical protein ACRDRI_13380 [Pseudonocardiaceae bacterium]
MGDIDLAGCAKLLGWPLPLAWYRLKVGKFASPAGTKNGQPFWHENDMYRWAARTHPILINRVPIRYWPDAKRPAVYRGAREIEDAVVQTWQVDAGTVCVLWSRSTTSAVLDLEILATFEERVVKAGRQQSDVIVVSAYPLPAPEANDDTLDEQRRRAGWLEILDRTDQLAVECVREACRWDGGADFPFSNPQQIDPTTEYGAEWAARLEPIERTAAFELIDFDGQYETLTDPETGAPVIRQPGGRLLAAIPQRLPAFSPLAEVILDLPIWVRTEDGMLHLAPRDSYYGLSWGYGGSGPGSLALLIHRLLDDITARGADSVSGAPEGLEDLTQTGWSTGTVLTRAQLETARDGRPYAEG